MPLHDASPERRNLVITSLGFVAYYFGGGAVDDELRLQVVSVAFSNIIVIASMAWVMLFWFMLRFSQTHRGIYINSLLGELKELNENKALVKFVERITTLKHKENNGFVLSQWSYDKAFCVGYKVISNISFTPGGKITDYTNIGTGNEIVRISGFSGYLMLIYLMFLCALYQRSFTEFVVPYLLFIGALLGPVYRGAL